MARVLKLNEGPSGPYVLVLSDEVPRLLAPSDQVELADRATVEALRLLSSERHDSARTGAKD